MALEAYPDSSFLFSLVAKDKHTPRASQYMLRSAMSLVFTPLHRIELRNALRNAADRKEITHEECRTAFILVEEDLAEKFLVHTAVEWTNIFLRADRLSEIHASETGQRTIDLIHVAMALECEARTFLSFHNRQRKLAKAAGLKVMP
jgi:predicted nucleic acid-binding protein